MRRVNARNLQLARGEFDQLADSRTCERRGEAVGHKLNRQTCFVENAADREVVRDGAFPTIRDAESLKRRASNRRRAAPTEVFFAPLTQSGRDCRIPDG